MQQCNDGIREEVDGWHTRLVDKVMDMSKGIIGTDQMCYALGITFNGVEDRIRSSAQAPAGVANQWHSDGTCRVCGSRKAHTHPFADPGDLPSRMNGLALVVGDSRRPAPIMLKGPHTYRKYWVMRFNVRCPFWSYEWVLCPSE